MTSLLILAKLCSLPFESRCIYVLNSSVDKLSASTYGDWGSLCATESALVYLKGILTMALSKERKQEIFTEYGTQEGDTGSTEVQVAMLTAQIQSLSEHLQANRKDHHGRRGLLMMVGKRKRLLKYLEAKDFEGYKTLIGRLGLRR